MSMKTGDIFQDATEAIELRHTADRNKVLLHQLDVRTRMFNAVLGLPLNKAVAFQIPDGFRTDGASIPRFLWWFVDPLDWWILFPSIVHDWCWRARYIKAFVMDMDTRLIEREIGYYEMNKHIGNLLMAEKMDSFYGGFVSRNIVYYTLELVRIITKKTP